MELENELKFSSAVKEYNVRQMEYKDINDDSRRKNISHGRTEVGGEGRMERG